MIQVNTKKKEGRLSPSDFPTQRVDSEYYVPVYTIIITVKTKDLQDSNALLSPVLKLRTNKTRHAEVVSCKKIIAGTWLDVFWVNITWFTYVRRFNQLL